MHLKTRINLIRVIIFSDRCGAQYKSKLPFHYLQNMGTDIPGEHCYHGSWLEKNLCDSLGGAVKSAEKRDVKAWNATIRNTASLLQLFSSFFLFLFLSEKTASQLWIVWSQRWFFLVKEEDLTAAMASSELKTLKGTRAIYSINTTSQGNWSHENWPAFVNPAWSSNPVNTDHLDVLASRSDSQGERRNSQLETESVSLKNFISG